MDSSTFHRFRLSKFDVEIFPTPTASSLVPIGRVTPILTTINPSPATTNTTPTVSSSETALSSTQISSTTQPSPRLTQSSVQQSQSPIIIGVFVGGVVGGFLLITLIVVLWRRRRCLTGNSTRPNLSETTSTRILRPNRPFTSPYREIGTHRNKLHTGVLLKKRERPGPMDAPTPEPSNERMGRSLGDQADTISSDEMTPRTTPARTPPDISEEVRLLRVLIRVIERPRLLTLAGDETSMANDVVDPPPGYE